MFNTLKKVINLDSKGGDKKVVPSNDTNPGNRTVPKNNNGRGLFAGLNATELKKEGTGGLVTARVSEEAQQSLDKAKTKGKEESASTYSNTSVSETVATLFSEGDTDDALNRLRSYINENEGKVEKRYWFMLMDIYQVLNDEKSFEKVGLIFSNSFGTSPPSWVATVDEKKSSVTGKNIIILEQKLTSDHASKFKEFLKESKIEKFCRINASQCKFEQCDLAGIVLFYKLLVDLRKNRVMSVLMGDNTLITFCKSYIDQTNSRGLREDFLSHEQDFWLFYLELLQWKGKKEEFEELSFEYAMKFELSPPDWDKEGVMSTEKSQDTHTEEDLDSPKLEKILTYNNIDNLFNFIKEKFLQQKTVEIDMSQIERIDFASVGSIAHFVQEVLAEDSSKQLIFNDPNEMILILFEMLGINEFVTINKKLR